MKPFTIQEISYELADAFNSVTHRHLPKSPPKMQIRKCYAVTWKGRVRAVAMLGNPVSPWLSADYWEVRRLASDGLYGACSALYLECVKHCRKADRLMVTYTFENETGNSLLAAGAKCIGIRKSGIDARKGRLNETCNIRKVRWEWK